MRQGCLRCENSASECGRRMGAARKGSALLFLICLPLLFGGCVRAEGENTFAGSSLNVYNWGEYIDPEVISLFQEETGIRVVYDMFETNEEMYPVIAAGGVVYDVVCPSDYMIEKLIANELLMPINYENIPYYKEIGEEYWELSSQFDPGNVYAVPYTTGTVGIIYNKGRLDELGIPYPEHWADLWDERLKGELLMQDSVRDAFMVALKKDGASLNTTDEAELDRARDELIRQKPLVQAYVVDQVRDKMIGGEAAVGIIYSGEMLYIQDEVSETELEMEYIVPEEGTNLWIDGWVIPKNARNPENAEKWINFLCRPDIAKMNFEYITYSTPNMGARALLDSEYLENEAVFPDMRAVLENGEVYHYLGEEDDAKYNNRWKTVKVS